MQVFFRAKLSYFYGWTHEEINRLAYKTAKEYYEAITVIEAQDNLVKMNITDYPSMGKSGRKSFYRQMRKKAYPEGFNRQMSIEDFAKKIGVKNG